MSAGREKGRVLVVEDDPHVREAVERALRFEGYEVHTAVDGNDALLHVDDVAPDAIVLDVLMPGTDGLAVCRILRDRGNHTPVLMLTARHEVSDRVAGLDAGADDYLVKPFAPEELLARVRALLRRGVAPDELLAYGDVVLDVNTSTCRRGGVEITLSAREAALLELLLRNPRQVVSRAQALERVWGGAAAASLNVVDRYISYPRRKLGDPPLIRTVRGVGFVLER
jgi:two-component system response regulator MprA